MMGTFKINWTDVIKGRVMATTIVKAFNVKEDVGLSFFARAVAAMMRPLRLQGAKETLHRSVIVAVARTAHARA